MKLNGVTEEIADYGNIDSNPTGRTRYAATLTVMKVKLSA